MIVEINGIKYRQKNSNAPRRVSPVISAAFMMAYAFNSLDPYAKRKQAIEVNIVKEYGLIQQKKSNLSKNQRDWVVYQFEKHFVKID